MPWIHPARTPDFWTFRRKPRGLVEATSDVSAFYLLNQPTMPDVTARTRPAVAVNLSPAQGMFGGPAWALNGTTSYLNFGTGPGIDNLGPMTWWCWAYTTAAAGNIAYKSDGNAGAGWWLTMATNQVHARMVHSSANVVSANAAFSSNVWHQVGVRWDGTINTSGLHVFVDGVVTGNATVVGSGTHGTDAAVDLWVGRPGGVSTSTAWWAGRIDHVACTRRLLSNAEIAHLYLNPFAFLAPSG